MERAEKETFVDSGRTGNSGSDNGAAISGSGARQSPEARSCGIRAGSIYASIAHGCQGSRAGNRGGAARRVLSKQNP